MKALVTGGAGFVGSNLVARLLNDGWQVVVIDNLRTGRIQHVENLIIEKKITFVEGDILDKKSLEKGFETGIDVVFHLAANADVRHGITDVYKDFDQNTRATLSILDSMKQNSVKKIVFASTGSIYGEASIIPTPENHPIPQQTSLYGAAKMSAENFIHAFAEAFEIQGYIFRLVSVLGPHYSHGHIFDFIQQLNKDPKELEILGDGTQTKSYMHIDDCIDGILLGLDGNQSINTFNLGVDDTCTVAQSAQWICERLGIQPNLNFGNGNRGWIGDNPHIHLDVSKITGLGWRPKYTLKQAIHSTCDYLTNNRWIFG